jgi:hypothetical protein
MKVYTDIPSSAIDKVVIDKENSTVEVTYASSNTAYTYSADNVNQFEEAFLAEYDQPELSFGRLINASLVNGNLTLLTETTTYE